jgi:transposase
MTLVVGVDIGSQTAPMAWRKNGKLAGTWTIEQKGKGHQLAVKKLLSLKPDLIVMEATGIYYLDLAIKLTNAGLPVAVINPKSAYNFAKVMLTNSKTDRIDAQLLAEYGERMTPRVWTPPTAQMLELRALGRHLNRLTGRRAQAKNELHALKATETTSSMLIEDEEEAIAALDERIERFRNAALDLILNDPELKVNYECLIAGPGIGEVSAIAMLSELVTLPQTMKSNQVSRYAGLDVRLTQSGTSLNKPGRMSKAGNAYLRSAMYMPSLSALRCDRYVKAFYESLVARGKKKMQAVGAIMRKYLTGVWACIRSGKAFDTAKLFSEKHQLKA